MGKSAGARIAASTASASAGSFVEEAEAVARRVADAGLRDVEDDVVSFSEAAPVRRVAERKIAVTGRSREVPVASAAGEGAGGCSVSAGTVAGAGAGAGSSSSSRFSMRLVSLPPGTHRFWRFSSPLASLSA